MNEARQWRMAGLAQQDASAPPLAKQRLELASLDAEEEWLCRGGLFAGTLVTALMLALMLASAAASVAIYFQHAVRLAAASGISAFFAVAGALLAWRLVRLARHQRHGLADLFAEPATNAKSRQR